MKSSVGETKKSSGGNGAVLAVLCLAVFVVQIDTTIVNVALPSLVRELGATTRQLQWIVDSYNLFFAALVLAAGSLSDRFGRKPALVAGLVLFGLSSLGGALSSTATQLIVARAFMGIGSAIIFPNTLSIISNVFTERSDRAKAIGLWGATTGIGIALAPITGGWLLQHFWWGSVFLIMVPIAAIAVVAVSTVVPNSKDPTAPHLDTVGLLLSTATIATIVYTVIEAPEKGWGSIFAIVGFTLSAALAYTFIRFERRSTSPMLDVSLFKNLRFSAASLSVTVAFFALAGFTFLITQYFQFLKGYTPLSTGVRLLPVALAVAVGNVLGAKLVLKTGTNKVMGGGLIMLTIGYAWVAVASIATTYLEVVGIMLVVGLAMGLVSAPATEAIMGAVPANKSGVGSAMNDATREFGATLGVAILGSVFASIYRSKLAKTNLSSVPAEALRSARSSIGGAYIAAEQLTRAGEIQPGKLLLQSANRGFFDGYQTACLTAAVVTALGAVFALRYLPGQPVPALDHQTSAPAQPIPAD